MHAVAFDPRSFAFEMRRNLVGRQKRLRHHARRFVRVGGCEAHSDLEASRGKDAT